ncbi:hypothetical protein GALL_128820 [mine drainage metagenome]|uniref:MG2 domain protein n=1 Tax=mine drainage metagenome TaxID=410659 RepID=A0A1J5SA54_9ZZZZ
MKNSFLTSCLTILVVLTANSLTAQSIDSVINIYGDNFQQEKAHLHFDKSVYNKGETIWFKAYLMAGTDPSNLSKNFYADWYDATGKLIAHNMFPVFGSSAKGQFNIPEDYASSTLHLRAYTKWMLNFDSAFLFEKDIIINQPQTKNKSTVEPITEVHLFPEGGDLVNGLNSKIAFLATNQNGNPVSIKGAIRNSKNELIDSFQTEHDGMGSFTIDKINANETYYVFWMDEFGKTGFNLLPAIKKTGAVIQAEALKNKILISIQRSADNTGSLTPLFLLAHMNQQVLNKLKINLENKTSALTEINTSDYPTGVLQLTLFNALWQPVAERIVFVNNHQYQFNAAINTITKGVDKRDKNIIEIDVADSVFANMSVSVTDAGLFQEKNNIVSQFLLSDDIKGKISNPSFYFENDEDSTKHFLDLVMMTHGWRRFNWSDIAKAKMPTINYQRDSDYIQIAGTASGRAFRNVEEKDFVTLILMAQDSSKQIIPIPMEQDGTFSKSGFMFFDSVNVYYRFKQKRLAAKTDIDFRTNIFSPKDSYLKGFNNYSLKRFDSAQLARELYFIAEQKRLEKLRSTTTLKDVVVTSRLKPKTVLDVADDKYTTGAFSFEAKDRVDVKSDPSAYTYMDIFRYLQIRIAGLDISPVQQGSASDALYNISLRGESPTLYLNEMQTDVAALASIPMSDIAYIKIFSTPFVLATGNGFGGAIAVYTRKGDERLNNSNAQAEKKILIGYTKYKEFYLPNYSDTIKNFAPDTRTTLYWNPFVLTNAKNKKVQLEFYNNDVSKKLRVVLEGMNADGKLVRVEKIIE